MIAPPAFGSVREHVSRLGDVDFWAPYLTEIEKRHGLFDSGREPVAGHNATYPTFVCDDIVIKLFGCSRSWRRAHLSEHAAQVLVSKDPEIAAPRLVGAGRLYDDERAPWPYLITTRLPGTASSHADLSGDQRLALAAALGRQVKRVHALEWAGAAKREDWGTFSVTAAARQSSLPAHLVAQIDGYLARLGPIDRVFVHGDICANHVFVEKGRLAGIIDWGDAMATDRHYELIQVFRDTFACDKALLRAFLDASDWPVDGEFPRKALGHALHRQALGLAQHHTMDVFEPVAALLPLGEIATLDELAVALFAV